MHDEVQVADAIELGGDQLVLGLRQSLIRRVGEQLIDAVSDLRAVPRVVDEDLEQVYPVCAARASLIHVPIVDEHARLLLIRRILVSEGSENLERPAARAVLARHRGLQRDPIAYLQA